MLGSIARFRRKLYWCAVGSSRPYKVFTRKFDKVMRAGELGAFLGPLSKAEQVSLDEAWQVFQAALTGWRTKLQVSALEASARIRDRLSDGERADTVVSILLDHSGSMRGQKILLSAAAMDVIQNFLSLLGLSVEILGFTTTSWRGGKSRRLWRRMLCPPYPGRLCDLLHVIYRDGSEQRLATAPHLFKAMLRPDLLKENVDGEALEWASSRLRTYPHRRKILLVVSDGAPVDDSTLQANDPEILDRHLREVIHTLETSGDIDIAAIGIGLEFDVAKYYSTSVTIHTAEDLGAALISLLERLLIDGARHDSPADH